MMNEKKYKRLEYLEKNIDYLTIRERQEYYELLSELTGQAQYPEDEMEDFDDFYGQSDSGNVGAFQGQGEGQRQRSNRASREDSPKASRHSFSSSRGRRNQSTDPYEEEEELSEAGSKLNKKKKPKKKKSWIKRILLALLLLILVLIGFFIYGYSRGVKHAGGIIQPEQFTSRKNSDGTINILLLGADQRPGQSQGASRTDSIMVLHIDKKNKKANLVSFMRDTLVNVSGVSPGNDADVKINAAFAIGEQNKQGVELLSQTLNQNFGVNCQYYAVIDFSGFATVIDSLFPGGIEIDAQFSTVNGQKLEAVPVPDDLVATEGVVSSDKSLSVSEAAALGYPDGGGIFMMIKSGKQKMNGRTLLNYARFRHDDEGDFGRVKRQQQVMSTIMSKMKNPLRLFTASSALGTARAITMSNLPVTFALTDGFGTLGAIGNGINSTTIPANNDWQNAYDIYGGLGLAIDMNKYRSQAQQLLGQ